MRFCMLASSVKLAEIQLGGFLFKKTPSWFSASYQVPNWLRIKYIYNDNMAGATNEILYAKQEAIQLVFSKFRLCCSISAIQQ